VDLVVIPALYRLAIDRPRTVLLAALLVVLAASPGLLHLRIRTDGNALVPERSPAIAVDRAIRADFGIEDQIVVAIESDDEHGIFNEHTVGLIDRLTRSIQGLPDVDPAAVISLATEKGDRVRTGTLRYRRFLEPMPRTRADLDRVRDDLEALQLFTGTIVSADGRLAAIFVGVDESVDRPDLIRRLHAMIDAERPLPERVHVVGAPVAESLLGTHLMEDLGVPAALLGHPSTHGAGEMERGGGLYGLRRAIGRTIGLVPLAIAIMAVVFLVTFRSVIAMLLPLVEVGACLVIVFSLMGWTGVPVYLTIAVMPVILTAVGIADEIHVYTRYRRRLGEHGTGDHVEQVRATMDDMWRPVVKTSLTSAIAFFSFALSPIGAVQAFGVFTAIGVLVCMLWSMTVIPACLVLVAPRRFVGRRASVAGAARSRLAPLATLALRGRGVVLLFAVIVIAAAPLGLRDIVVQDSWIEGFDRASPFRRATALVNDQCHGTHILFVCVGAEADVREGTVAAEAVAWDRIVLPRDALADPAAAMGQWIQVRDPAEPEDGRPFEMRSLHRSPPQPIVYVGAHADRIEIRAESKEGRLVPGVAPDGDGRFTWTVAPRTMLMPDTIRALCGLEAFIAERADLAVGGVLGPCGYLETTNFIGKARAEGSRIVPDDPTRILWLWQQYGRVRTPVRLREVVDLDHARVLLAVYMKHANFRDTAELIEDIRDYEREHLAPRGLRVSLAGDVAVSQTLIEAIVTTQVRSLLLSLIGIVLVTSILGRSLGWGLLCCVPCALAVLVNFAVMGALGIPLGVATSMFSAMTLGIGIDYAIHLTERHRVERAAGASVDVALRRAITGTGPALLIDAAAIVLGFGVLTLSQVPSNARLGGLVVLSVATCLVATLVVLPAVIAAAAGLRDRRVSRAKIAG
jgi:predicted RND superfamily exporter protein